MEEQWKPIEGHEDYEVSNTGKVRTWKGHFGKRLEVPALLKLQVLNGHPVAHFSKFRNQTSKRVANLVLKAFEPPTKEIVLYVLYRDFDTANCNLDNLYWGTRSDWSTWTARRHDLLAGEPLKSHVRREQLDKNRAQRKARRELILSLNDGKTSLSKAAKIAQCDPSYVSLVWRGLR